MSLQQHRVARVGRCCYPAGNDWSLVNATYRVPLTAARYLNSVWEFHDAIGSTSQNGVHSLTHAAKYESPSVHGTNFGRFLSHGPLCVYPCGEMRWLLTQCWWQGRMLLPFLRYLACRCFVARYLPGVWRRRRWPSGCSMRPCLRIGLKASGFSR